VERDRRAGMATHTHCAPRPCSAVIYGAPRSCAGDPGKVEKILLLK
jgi:hypothetical protein